MYKTNPLAIVLTVIITALITGGGVYLWQNREVQQELPKSDNNTTVAKNETPRVPASNLEVKQRTIEPETTNWKAYESTSLGLGIKYPNDPSYSIETPEDSGFIITQPHPGNRIHIRAENTRPDVGKVTTKTIMGTTYSEFYRPGIGLGYGYFVERNGKFYVFESVWGPKNEVLESMMTTVRFK